MRKNAFQSFLQIIRRVDCYGHPINLTYEGQSTFKSLLGGLFTILTRMAILAFFISELIQVVHKKSNIQVS